MDPVKSTRGTSHGWLTAEPPAPGDDPDLPDGENLAGELCEAVVVRLDSSTPRALLQQARA